MPEIIQFDDPVLLVGGGELAPELLKQFNNLPMVAADGGANHLQRMACGALCVPEIIVGDLDSLDDRAYWEGVTRVVEINEQDSTDFEKCLYSVDAPYFIAVGFCGHRLDHTLAALHAMQKFCGQKRVILVSSHDVLLVSAEPVSVQLPLQTRVSIYPLPTVTFDTSEGLEYPLNGLTLQQGQAIGTSNSSVCGRVKINPVAGCGVFALILPVECLAAVRHLYEVASNSGN